MQSRVIKVKNLIDTHATDKGSIRILMGRNKIECTVGWFFLKKILKAAYLAISLMLIG